MRGGREIETAVGAPGPADPGRGDSRDARAAVRFRNRSYRLRPSDLETMGEIGRFRTVAEDDLRRHRFAGSDARMHGALGALARQGLVRRYTVGYREEESVDVCVLTREGKRLLERGSHPAGQTVHAELRRPSEVFHDAAVYRMYRAEQERIAASGGRVLRVVLDRELMARIYPPLSRARTREPWAATAVRDEVARANGLRVVDGRIPLPDLRIEYETSAGERAKVDLELATGHYSQSQLAGKARAGFRVYLACSPRPGSGGLQPPALVRL